MRTEEDAILVGKQIELQTIALSAKEWPGKPNQDYIDRNLKYQQIVNYIIDAKHYIQRTENSRGISILLKWKICKYYLPQKIAYQLYLMDIQSYY
ncbi:hypothetical protein CS542_10430 [Pedobacter sp. IW39]|nr:hypothetical protein CS542_10430 [Pedobacter sp. IW39]